MAKGNNRRRNNYKSYKTSRGNNHKEMPHERFASASASVSGTSSKTSLNGVTESKLKTLIQDPSKNGDKVAGISKTTSQINGMYKRIIKYMSSILTYDHTIYPVLENPLAFAEDPSTLQIAFAQTAIFLDRLNIRFYAPIIAEKVFTSGTVYLYKLEDSKGVAYQEMPLNYCRVGYIEDGVYRYQFDITKLSESTAQLFPKEIQNAYQSYKNGKTDKLIDGKYWQVSDKGVAFTIDTDVLNNAGMSLPPLANVLIDVIKIENAKASMEDESKLDNAKIIHSKIETDDKGTPLMELPVVLEYHNALKRALPDGAVAITNPFETTSIPLNGTGADGKFSLLNKAIENLYDGAGVSKQLFAGDGTSSQALERSIKVDCQWLYSFLLPMFANYYNYELKKATKKGIQWKIKFLQTSYFDRNEAIKTAKDQLSFGGSRLEYLAYCGMSPLEVANMLIFEQRVLHVDDFMVAKQTSYTQSGESDGEVGAPESNDPTDTTVRIKDSQ